MVRLKQIALISPKRPLWAKNSNIYKMFDENKKFIRPWYAPPLGLITIAGLTPSEINVDIIDEDFEEIDFSKSYDLVGISSMTQQANRAYEIATEFKKKGVPVVMGGIHATVIPDEALNYVDTVIIGEAEELWIEYLDDFIMGNPRRVYKNESNCYFNLENSPLPRYDLLKPEYFKKTNDYFNFIPIQATRGCPHNCSFCLVTKIYGKKIRKKKIENVIREIEEIKKSYKAPLILFTDDNFFVDKKYTKELLKALIPYKIKWFGQADIKVSEDEELLKLAYQSGCITLLIGFESLNPSNLEEVNANQWKMKQIKKYEDVVNKIQENGIVVYAAFIIGFDHDDTSTFGDIRNFVIKNNCPGQFTFLTPLPGSRTYDKYCNEDRLLNKTYWDQTNFFDIVIKHPKMSYNQMEEGLIWLYNEVFNEKRYLERVIFMKNKYKKITSRWIS